MDGIVEGRNAVLETLRAGADVTEVMIAGGSRPAPALEEIRRLAADAGVPVREVRREELDSLSARGAHQGAVARTAGFEYAMLQDIVAAASDEAVVLVLDHVEDPGNLGAVIRSAEALGATGVVIPKARAASVGRVAQKAAAGATAHIPVAQVSNIVQALADLKDGGFWVAGATERATDAVWDARLDGKLAFVLGAEGAGLSRLAEERCDFTVRIPLSGRTSSLNVAQAATVLLYERARRATGRGMAE
jgi:23S rRNA (guanosine2251-2'-O)-methyltransferase